MNNSLVAWCRQAAREPARQTETPRRRVEMRTTRRSIIGANAFETVAVARILIGFCGHDCTKLSSVADEECLRSCTAALLQLAIATSVSSLESEQVLRTARPRIHIRTVRSDIEAEFLRLIG